MKGVLGGRYRLVALLGRGGMGEVWRGVDTKLGRSVAVKMIRGVGVADAGYNEVVKRFDREAQALAALNHPNIVTAHDFGVDDDGDERTPYLVMEFLDGRSLADEITDRVRVGRGPFPVDRVVAIGLDVCAGLSAAHRAGVVHRDLKPANLMTVAGPDRIKIVDFGIAHSVQLSRLTGTGGLLGTYAYMAPERMTGGEVDGRADLYALGCVLYELLTGGPPFVATDAARFVYLHVNTEPRPLCELRPDAPVGLEALLLDLLAKAPGQRPADADAVAARLKLLSGPAAETPTVTRPAPAPPAGVNRPDGVRQVMPVAGSAPTTITADPPPVRPDTPDAKPRPTGRRRHRGVARYTVVVLSLAALIAASIYTVANLPSRHGGGGQPSASGSGSTPARSDIPVSGPHQVAILTGHSSFVGSVAFSPDGKTLASGSFDNTIRLWNETTHAPVATLTPAAFSAVYSVAFSPDGKTLANGGYDDTIRLWNVATHARIATLTGHTGYVNSVAFSPDGKTLASGSSDDTIRLWNAATHAPVATLTGHTSGVESVAFSPDGKTLASGGYDDTIRLWNAATHAPVATLTGHTGYVDSVAFSPDGKTLASGGRDKTIRLWNVTTHAAIATFIDHTDYVFSVAFSPDGTILASGGRDATIRLWQFGGP